VVGIGGKTNPLFNRAVGSPGGRTDTVESFPMENFGNELFLTAKIFYYSPCVRHALVIESNVGVFFYNTELPSTCLGP